MKYMMDVYKNQAPDAIVLRDGIAAARARWLVFIGGAHAGSPLMKLLILLAAATFNALREACKKN